jgi:hypothetical protein
MGVLCDLLIAWNDRVVQVRTKSQVNEHFFIVIFLIRSDIHNVQFNPRSILK